MAMKSTHPDHEEDVYADEDEEQGIVKKISKEDDRLAIESGDKDEDPYEETGREELRENDEIDDWEEGFMEGATGKGQMANCAYCNKPLPGKSKVVEKMVDGEVQFYCSAKCASTD